jgi:short-subunit dehydrogenase
LASGSREIKSITKAKDLASTLWREHSSTYDNKRAVQLLVDNPGTGDSIKRTRTDDTEKKDTMEELARSQPMEVKTIDNMRLSLLAIEVYERL